MIDGRERLTMTHLHVQTLRLAREGKTETTITFDEFHDLRREMEFINLFGWATMDGVPKSFTLHGILVTVKHE